VPRLPLLPAEPDDPVLAEGVPRVPRRGARADLGMYRTLAHAPLALRGFSAAGRSLRAEASAPAGRCAELVIMRTAQLAGSDYEWSHHRPMALAAGLRDEQLAALGGVAGQPPLRRSASAPRWRLSDEVHATALSDEAFAALERSFPAGEVVELILTAAFYQAVARGAPGAAGRGRARLPAAPLPGPDRARP